MITCRHCGHQIAPDADTCPNCGGATENAARTHIAGCVVVLAVMAAAAIGALLGGVGTTFGAAALTLIIGIIVAAWYLSRP